MGLLHVTGDLGCFDGLEGVHVSLPGNSTPVAVAGALRRSVTTREAEASDGTYTASDLKWHLPVAQLESAPPLGSVITAADGEPWTVLEVAAQTLGERWLCWTRNLVIAGGLNQTITIQQATWTKTASGAPQATWTDYRTDLPARVQPISSRIEVQHDQRLARVTHQVFLAEQVLVDQNFRVLHDGAVYNLLGYREPDRIDRLIVLDVELVPWPLS
jgi:head-tail adaptor